MDPNYQQQPGYAHYKSASFNRRLELSIRIFNKIVFGNHFRYPRPFGPPNSPAELSDDDSEYDSDDGYEGICGPDEDYHISMAEGISIGYWPYNRYGYWPEGVYGLAIGFSKPREYK